MKISVVNSGIHRLFIFQKDCRAVSIHPRQERDDSTTLEAGGDLGLEEVFQKSLQRQWRFVKSISKKGIANKSIQKKYIDPSANSLGANLGRKFRELLL